MANENEQDLQRQQNERLLREQREEKIAREAEEAEQQANDEEKRKEQQQSKKEKSAYENAESYHTVSPLNYADNPGLFLMAMHFKYAQFKKDKKADEKKRATLDAAKRKLNEPDEEGKVEAGKKGANDEPEMNLGGEVNNNEVFKTYNLEEDMDRDKFRGKLENALKEINVSNDAIDETENGFSVNLPPEKLEELDEVLNKNQNLQLKEELDETKLEISTMEKAGLNN